MIRPIDIRLNAAHPELPLAEAVTFTGAPSTVLVRGVPPNCGRWAITAVFVAATYPDGSTTTRAAVQSANGVWVATLPATARSGRTENGLRVMADGIDENGAAVTGYILGVADFAVASLGVTPAPQPGETSWQMLYFDAVPGTLRKGDVAKVDGVLKLYNGTAWEAFAGDIPAPSTATPAMDGTGAAGTSAAFARGDHVHPTDTSRVPTSRTVNGKALTDDVTLTGADIPLNPSPGAPNLNSVVNTLTTQVGNAQTTANDAGVAATAANSKIDAHAANTTIHVTSTEKATWNGKQSALSAQQLANIAAVSDALAFDATHTYEAGDPVVYDGTLYTFTATHTGAWTGSDVSTVDIIARLAGKATKADVDPLLFAQYYPEGNVKSAAEFTLGIKYDDPDTIDRTITVRPFCNMDGTAENDNSNLSGRVVIPPFVDESGNGYISDDGTKYKVIEVSGDTSYFENYNLTAVIAPNTVANIGASAFYNCRTLVTASLPAATSIGDYAFYYCTSLASVSFPAATSIGDSAFEGCTSLTSVDFGDIPRSSVPSLGTDAFYGVPTSCTIIVPYTQYDAWIAADGWRDLPQEFVRHAEKADKPATFTTGNLAKFDSDGNPTDSTIPAANVALKGEIPYSLVAKTIDNGAVTLDDRAINAVAVSSSLASLTVNFPTATSGRVRDFGLRLTVASGITTAPELALPQGVTCENADGEAPEIGADGAATILYFTETASGVFLVKGEVVTAIS